VQAQQPVSILARQANAEAAGSWRCGGSAARYNGAAGGASVVATHQQVRQCGITQRAAGNGKRGECVAAAGRQVSRQAQQKRVTVNAACRQRRHVLQVAGVSIYQAGRLQCRAGAAQVVRRQAGAGRPSGPVPGRQHAVAGGCRWQVVNGRSQVAGKCRWQEQWYSSGGAGRYGIPGAGGYKAAGGGNPGRRGGRR